MKKLLALTLLCFVGLAGCDQAQDAAKNAAGDAAAAAKGAASEFMQGGVDLMAKATDMSKGLTETLGKITDEASAKAAVPGLEAILKTVTGLGDSVDNLPATARSAFSTKFAEALPGIKELIDKVSAMPGVGEIVKPVLEKIMERLLNL